MQKTVFALLVAAMVFSAIPFVRAQQNEDLIIEQKEEIKKETAVKEELAQPEVNKDETPRLPSGGELPKDQIISIATEQIKAKGVNIEEVNVVYDEGNRLWSEKIGVLSAASEDPNRGVLTRGFLKNYRTVFFDFKDPLPDVWVFVDKDTGEVLEVYQQQ